MVLFRIYKEVLYIA